MKSPGAQVLSAEWISPSPRKRNSGGQPISVTAPGLLLCQESPQIKKAGTRIGPGKCWLVARINLSKAAAGLRPARTAEGCPHKPLRLRAPSRTYRQVPHLGQDARHLHPVQLRDEGQ